MTDLQALHINLQDVAKLPMHFDRIRQPVKLNDGVWPNCKCCGLSVNGCRCVEYRP